MKQELSIGQRAALAYLHITGDLSSASTHGVHCAPNYARHRRIKSNCVLCKEHSAQVLCGVNAYNRNKWRDE